MHPGLQNRPSFQSTAARRSLEVKLQRLRRSLPLFVDRYILPRSSSPEVRIRVPFFSVVHFSRGTLPPKKGKRALLGDLANVIQCFLGQGEPRWKAWFPEAMPAVLCDMRLGSPRRGTLAKIQGHATASPQMTHGGVHFMVDGR